MPRESDDSPGAKKLAADCCERRFLDMLGAPGFPGVVLCGPPFVDKNEKWTSIGPALGSEMSSRVGGQRRCPRRRHYIAQAYARVSGTETCVGRNTQTRLPPPTKRR